jgi:hypothetical protein
MRPPQKPTNKRRYSHFGDNGDLQISRRKAKRGSVRTLEEQQSMQQDIRRQPTRGLEKKWADKDREKERNAQTTQTDEPSQHTKPTGARIEQKR